MDSQLDSLLILSLASGLGPIITRRAIAAMGSAQAVVECSVHQLAQVEGVGQRKAQDLRRSMDEVLEQNLLVREKALIEEHHVTLIAFEDESYPALLRHISDPPPMLYVRGDIRKEDALALAVVGARKCSGYGREQADRLSALCVQSGLTIISGGAMGIDTAAHHAAVRAGGRTIAVLGSGLAQPYPSENKALFDRIAGDDNNQPRGAVISELPMTAPPIAQNFPRRNRIVSGMSLGVLVIEASLRSGALITARIAAEEHGREVLALPGRVDSNSSAGCHKIIREGWATLVTNAADILDGLGETGSLLKAGMTVDEQGRDRPAAEPSLFEQNLSDSQQKIIAALSQPRQLEELAGITGLPVHKLQADLTMLQIRSAVAKEGMMYRRSRTHSPGLGRGNATNTESHPG